MSVPRVLLIPTHRTGVADAVAAVAVEILSAQGREVRYHHVGPMSPISSWDRSEGAVFIDPGLIREDAALGLYEVAVRHADLSLLSSTTGLSDRREGVRWAPADLAGLLDCPVVVVMDCRGWGTGIRVLVSGLKASLRSIDLAGVILTGVRDPDHCQQLKGVCADEGIRVVGCLHEGQGLDWDSGAPGAWGLPLSQELVEAVSRQVDIDGLAALADRRGFLATHKRFSDRGGDGPVVVVASGQGFTQWSRDSVEVLRSAGAQLRRLDLLHDSALPVETAGLVVAGTLWPETVQDVSMNTSLLGDIRAKVENGLPTLAMGGGMSVMLAALQDTLGRTSEFAGVVPARGEILWDLEEPVYVEVTALRDSVLLKTGDKVMGWATSEAELTAIDRSWEPPLVLRGAGAREERRDSFGSDTLLCSPAMIHLAAAKGSAARFIEHCERFAAGRRDTFEGDQAPGQ